MEDLFRLKYNNLEECKGIALGDKEEYVQFGCHDMLNCGYSIFTPVIQNYDITLNNIKIHIKFCLKL
jgi:hypothetical protein